MVTSTSGRPSLLTSPTATPMQYPEKSSPEPLLTLRKVPFSFCLNNWFGRPCGPPLFRKYRSSRPSPSKSNRPTPEPMIWGDGYVPPTGPGSCVKSMPSLSVTSSNHTGPVSSGSEGGGSGGAWQPRADSRNSGPANRIGRMQGPRMRAPGFFCHRPPSRCASLCLRRGSIPGTGHRCPVQLAIVPGEFRHLDGLVHGDVAEDLGRPAGRPADFQLRDGAGPAQPDGLLQRVGPEAAPGRDVTVDGQRPVPG